MISKYLGINIRVPLGEATLIDLNITLLVKDIQQQLREVASSPSFLVWKSSIKNEGTSSAGVSVSVLDSSTAQSNSTYFQWLCMRGKNPRI